MHTYNEVYQETLNYFGGDDLATKVFIDKYALRDNNKQLLEKSPQDMHERIARELARIERKKFKEPYNYDFILSCLEGFKRIVPQGSLLYGVGNEEQFVTLSNCYVVDSPYDSYGGIHRTDEHITQISKRRGGCGVDVSTLRPDMAMTRNSSRTSSGPISFIKRYSHSIREVGQDGRRGALMIMMNVHHPNISQFIECKKDLKEVTGANISVKITDEFLKAVEEDKEYQQRWPIEGDPQITEMVSARLIWKSIAKSAWQNGEPGVAFWDNYLRECPADCYAEEGFKTIATNPCGELNLCKFDSCRLMLLNMYSFVENPFTKDADFRDDQWYKYAQVAQRLMDDVVDLELEAINKIIYKVQTDPEPEAIKENEKQLWNNIREKCELGRRTGLGTTGFQRVLNSLTTFTRF
jgi:ribonucleoside-diphosphate reductase alpha chain